MKKLFQVFQGGKDKRQKKRVELFSNIPAKVEILGISANAKIKDVSYGGFGLVLPTQEQVSIIESLEAKLEMSGQTFQTTIANKVLLPNQEIKLGLSLPVQAKRDVNFNMTDSTWDYVTDLETVQNIYHDLAFKGPEAPIYVKQNFTAAVLFPMQVTESETLICEIFQVNQGSLERGKLRCTFDLFQTCHSFDSNIERMDQNKIELKLPKSLARLLRRETVRIRKTSNEYEVSVVLKNQNLGKEISEFEVFDYSEHGLSLIDPNGNLSLPRNLSFDEVIVDIKGVGTIKGRGQVRSYEWNRQKNAYIIGLLFEQENEPHLTNWHNFILKARYPALDFTYKPEDHKKIWSLFDVSGYFEFKEEGAFTDMIDLTSQSWEKLSDAGTQFAKKAMIRMEDKVVGHIQMDRIYDKTWCLHHLALDPSIRITVARDLLSLTPDVLLSEGGEYVINFTDSNNTWNKKSYYNFIKDYKQTDHNALRSFVTYDLDTLKEKFTLEKSPNIEIRLANKYDVKRILNDINIRYTATEIDACGYNEDPHLQNISAYLEKYGLKRSREYMVAIKDGEMIGYSILESGSEGINIIGVINLCYVNIVKDVEEVFYNKVYESLMYEAVEYYRNKQIRYVLFQLENPKQDYQSKGLRFMCNTSRWIAVKAVFSRFSAYTNLLYGHLATRRELLRDRINERKK